MPKVKHITEYFFLKTLFTMTRFMPWCVISGISHVIGIFIASLPIEMNRVARSNIRIAFPDLDESSVQKIHEKSTINMARTFLEMPKIYSLSKKSIDRLVEIEDFETLEKKPSALILTAHIGNWDMLLKAVNSKGFTLGNVYRKANNPLTDKLITKIRQLPEGEQFPKGREGSIPLVKAIKNGLSVGFLNDQRLREGVSVKLFNKEADTAGALAELANKYDRAVVPVFCIRQNGNFKLIIEPSIKLSGDTQKDTQTFNDVTEKYIRKYPEQWMWMHKRFVS